MRIKNSRLSSIKELEPVLNKPWPVKTGFHLARLYRMLTEQHEVYQEFRDKLIFRYAAKGEDGKPKVTEDGGVFIPPENREELLSKLSDLDNEEIEIAFEPLKVSVDDIPEMSPLELSKILDFVEID